MYYLRFSLVSALFSTVQFLTKTSVSAWCALIKCVEQVVNIAVAESRTVWCLSALVTFTHIQADLIFQYEKPNENCYVIFEIDTSSHKSWPLCATDVN
jgi:hypothetical protein